MSIISGGGGARIIRSQTWVAQQTALRQRQAATIHQNNRMMQQTLRLSHAAVQEMVHEVASVVTTADQLNAVIEQLTAIREDAQQERIERQLQESPYSGLMRLLPANKSEW